MTIRHFDGKTVLITGAAAGLGRALCIELAALGARVGGLDRDAAGLEDLCRCLGADSCAVRPCDVRDEAAVAAAVEGLCGELGPPDVVIANAGITHIRNFDAHQVESVRRVMEVNFLGAVHLTAACLDALVERRGSIIVISSVAGFAPLLGRSGYCASKHALHGFFDTLRLELRHTGVGVMLVCPSYIATGIRRGQADGTAAASPTAAASSTVAASNTAETGQGRSRVVGREDSPTEAARAIIRAAQKGCRQLALGRVGVAAYWLRRLAPRVYEALMLRRVRDE